MVYTVCDQKEQHSNYGLHCVSSGRSSLIMDYTVWHQKEQSNYGLHCVSSEGSVYGLHCVSSEGAV